MKPAAKVRLSETQDMTFSLDAVFYAPCNVKHGDKLYTADQLRQAKVEVLREAAHKQAEFGRGGDLLRMADELERSKT